MKNSFFSQFAPQEPKFFPMLRNLSKSLVDSSSLLVESMKFSSQDKRNAYYKCIKEVERNADIQANNIFDELGKTFITPFDREDIHNLASTIDDVIDGINNCAKRITIYNPHPISESGIELCQFIHQGAVYIAKAMDELASFRKHASALRECCTKLHEIENQADDIYELFVKNLFEKETDCIELIKIKEIMQELERTTDTAERVGKILRNLIVKYA